MKIYYAENNERRGPVSLEELKALGIERGTLVWFSGLDQWKRAEELDVIKVIFDELPPELPIAPSTPNVAPQPTYTYREPVQQPATDYKEKNPLLYRIKPYNWLIPSIVVLIMTCNVFAIIPIIFASQVDDKFYAQDFAGAERMASNAKLWFFITLGIYILLFIILIIIGFIWGDVATNNSSNFEYYNTILV